MNSSTEYTTTLIVLFPCGQASEVLSYGLVSINLPQYNHVIIRYYGIRSNIINITFLLQDSLASHDKSAPSHEVWSVGVRSGLIQVHSYMVKTITIYRNNFTLSLTRGLYRYIDIYITWIILPKYYHTGSFIIFGWVNFKEQPHTWKYVLSLMYLLLLQLLEGGGGGELGISWAITEPCCGYTYRLATACWHMQQR